jgi:hypothetical protein
LGIYSARFDHSTGVVARRAGWWLSLFVLWFRLVVFKSFLGPFQSAGGNGEYY